MASGAAWPDAKLRVDESRPAETPGDGLGRAISAVVAARAELGFIQYRPKVADKVTRNLDTENVLFYNVGAAPFRNVATRILRFDRIRASPPASPSLLAFEPRHYVRYQRETRGNTFQYVEGPKLAHCLPVVLGSISEIRDKTKLPRLWWLFKRAVVKATGATWSPRDPFAVQLHISGPAKCRLNLADVVKPLMDGFISALHHYEGNQLDDVAGRISILLKHPIQYVRRFLLDDRNALLGPRAVPHLYGDGLQWSPADHHLIAGMSFVTCQQTINQ